MDVNCCSPPLELRQQMSDYYLSGTVIDIPNHIGQSHLYDFRDKLQQRSCTSNCTSQATGLEAASRAHQRYGAATQYSVHPLVNDGPSPCSLYLSRGKSDVARFFQKVLDSPMSRGLMKHAQTIASPLYFDEAWRFYTDERSQDLQRLKAGLLYDDSLRYRSSDADPEMLVLVKSSAERDVCCFMNGVHARDLQDFAQDHCLDAEVCAPASDEVCGIRVSEDHGTYSMQLLFGKAGAIPVPFDNLPSETWQVDRSAELRETQWFQTLLRRGKRKHKGRRLDRVGRKWGHEKPWPEEPAVRDEGLVTKSLRSGNTTSQCSDDKL